MPTIKDGIAGNGAYMQENILGPLGMTNSAWTLARTSRDRLVISRMRVARGLGAWTSREAPLFDLGASPSGNLVSTVHDLAKFASAMMADGGGLLA